MASRIVFETELKRLQESVEAIGTEVQILYMKIFMALSEKNKEELAEICQSQQSVYRMQRNIESDCLNLITKQQPIARDLRQVTAALKMVGDISRIGDQCVDIAELLLRMNMKDLQMFSMHLFEMISETREQLTDAIDAFVKRDPKAASKVIIKDDIVDGLFNQVKEDLIQNLKKGLNNPDDCIDVLMIAKYLEKIGDHAVNMAEWGIFRETGEVNQVRLL